ncbi:hypothetical protein E8E11_000201 [Didymella keratinophila]|nr:hypothetical protein E8E11_000201 [Didymella keratinophila]
MAMDLALTMTPLSFFVVASMCISLDKRPTSKYGENLKAITLVSPTIFPII